MNRVFDFFKTVWSWFYERTVIWCIFAFFLLMGWGQLHKNELTAELKEEHLNCKLECLPMSSEYYEQQCWCYLNEGTLIKLSSEQ